MKKVWIILSVFVLVFAIGTTAAVAAVGDDVINFGRMLPHMKQMHPDITTDELKKMYENCHGTGGASQSNQFQPGNMGGMMGV